MIVNRMLRMTLGGWLSLGLLLATTSVAEAQSGSAVPQLDLDRLMGTWYEIARLPTKAEKHCVSDAMVLYAVGDKPHQFQVVNSCQIKNGSTDPRNATGKVADKLGGGRLKISYLFPFSSKYWVLAMGPEYEWALIGSPNHKTLWVLSRMSSMKPELLAEIEAKAAAQGFNTSKLVMVEQHH
jgi:apolipoprotein D and lipocalin family protein